MLRAQDLADVIGLIRARKLTPAFARYVAKDVRADYRSLLTAMRGR